MDACLAVAEQSGPTDPTATHLAPHLMAINRWWPGATRSRPTNGMADMIIRALDGLDSGADRERWMSEDPERLGR